MFPLHTAFSILLDGAEPLSPQTVPITDAAGRVAAADLAAPYPVPGFRRAMMDGYVCHAADLASASPENPVILKVSGRVIMGEEVPPGAGPPRGGAWAVSTGGPMPDRGDTVVPLELALPVSGVGPRPGAEGPGKIRIKGPYAEGRNVAGADEDVRRGELVVAAGDTIKPGAVGALVAAGLGAVPVVKRPRVLLIATGPEVETHGPGAEPSRPKPGRVFNSSGAILGAELTALGVPWQFFGNVSDDDEQLNKVFQSVLQEAEPGDVIISTGGVSVGRGDRVIRTWLDLGARRLVGRIDIKPGGPFFAGRLRGRWLIGLSGTPLAALVIYHLLVRPLLLKLEGRKTVVRPVQHLPVSGTFGKPADQPRALWVETGAAPGVHCARILTGSGASGRMAPVARANGLLWMPLGTPPLKGGEVMPVLRLDLPENTSRLALPRDPSQLAPKAGPGGGVPAGGAPRPISAETPGSQSSPGRSARRARGLRPGGSDGIGASAGVPVLAITGPSDSGKTVAASGLVERLAAEGFAVVAVKHAAHGFTLDRPGTDSHRLARSGAAAVWLAGPGETAVRYLHPGRELSYRHVIEVAAAGYADGAGQRPHLILVEGYSGSSLPRIEVGAGAGAGGGPADFADSSGLMDPSKPLGSGGPANKGSRVVARLPRGFRGEDLDALAAAIKSLFRLRLPGGEDGEVRQNG